MRFLKIVALLLVLAILAGGAMYMLKLEREDNDRMRALYNEAEPLERQREALIKERDELPTQYALQFRDYATAEILFPRLDSQVYTGAYPIMREQNMVGMIGISPAEHPAMAWNKMGIDEFKALLADGWGLCMVYEYAWGQFDYFFNTISSLCKLYDVPMPTSIYYINNDYKPEDDEILKAHGVKTVIVNASNGRSTVTDVTGDLWFTGAMPWSYTGAEIDRELLGRTDGANMTYTVTFNETWFDPKTGESKNTQEEEAFRNYVTSMKEMMYFESPLDDMEQVASAAQVFVDTANQDQLYELYLQELTPEQQILLPRFRLTTYDGAIQFHLDAIENSKEKKAEMEARQAELNEQIAQLDTQIAEIYARWNGTDN